MFDFLDELWDDFKMVIIWLLLTLAFFIGLFLFGVTLRFLSAIFLAGWRIV